MHVGRDRIQHPVRSLDTIVRLNLMVVGTGRNLEPEIECAVDLHLLTDFFRIGEDEARRTQVDLLGSDRRVMHLENQLRACGNPPRQSL